jgi:hypothetical protein
MGKLALVLAFSLVVVFVALSPPPSVKATTYVYSITGAFDEDTGVLYDAIPINVTAYFSGYPAESFLVYGNQEYQPLHMPSYFDFDLGYIHRQYWLSANETEGFINIFNTTDLIPVVIQFQDLTGMLTTSDRCEVYNAEREFPLVVEKQIVDVTKKCILHLKPGKAYDIHVSNNGTYDYGNVIITSSTINLVIRPVSFPSDVVLAYQYVRMYGTRDFSTPTGSITVDYEDTLDQTALFTYTILLDNGTVVLPPTTFTGQSTVVSTWMGAANDTGYTVRATITHTQFGSMSWNHYFPREFSSPPFSLDWMGTWPITSSAVIPAFLILFAFGSFSVLNAYVGAFFGMVTASLLSYWGWLVIPSQMLVLGWVLAILVGIAANKRRLFT